MKEQSQHVSIPFPIDCTLVTGMRLQTTSSKSPSMTIAVVSLIRYVRARLELTVGGLEISMIYWIPIFYLIISW